MSKIIDELAFLVHEPSLYDHWKDIWRLLNPNEFVILLMDTFRQESHSAFARNVQSFMDLIESQGFRYVFVNDLLKSGDKYSYVISNHVVAGETLTPGIPMKLLIKDLLKTLINLPLKLVGSAPYELYRSSQYISMRCGVDPIRIMYGADVSDGWSLAQWNEQYRAIFCHGPNDEKAVRSRFDAEVFQMGYPRYDNYFNDPITADENSLFEEFSLSRKKKTLVWLPTLGEGVCSIPFYAEHVAGLMKEFNVVVRPHPISFRQEPENIELLERLDFRIDSDDVRDMNRLYALADFVVCDYGGPSFSALYLDKNIVQLTVPGADSWYTSARSSNLELQKLLSPVIDLNHAANLSEILNDEALWQRQIAQREKAFQRYFAPYRGTSSKRVVELLRQLLSVKTNPPDTADALHPV